MLIGKCFMTRPARVAAVVFGVLMAAAPCAMAGSTGGYALRADADPDGDGVVSGADNCPDVFNPSQRDGDHDGVGDACAASPRLYVSNNPADGADYATIGAAVAAVRRTGTTIAVYPGTGPYVETVQLAQPLAVRIERFDDGSGRETVIDGGGAQAIVVAASVRPAATTLDGLTLQGNTGVLTNAALDAANLTFRTSAFGLDVAAGADARLRAAVVVGGNTGANVAAGATLTAERCRITGASEGVMTNGVVSLVDTLIADGRDGVLVQSSTGAVSLRYATLARFTALAIYNNGGTATVDRSIIWRAQNGLCDVPCVWISRSVVDAADCSTVAGNAWADALLAADYSLSAGSPCIDYGTPPPAESWEPTLDLAGRPRRLDGNGDGIAVSDCGALEYYPADRTPGEIRNVRWTGKAAIAWDADAAAATYHQYRGALGGLSPTSFGACGDAADANLADTAAPAEETPAPGAGVFYLVTGRDAAGHEGTLGYATGAERSRFSGCPASAGVGAARLSAAAAASRPSAAATSAHGPSRPAAAAAAQGPSRVQAALYGFTR